VLAFFVTIRKQTHKDMDLRKTLKKYKAIHSIVLCVYSCALLVIWIMKNARVIKLEMINNPQMLMTLQYLGIIITGLGIWYGYYHYDKILKAYKNDKDAEVKKEKYLSSKLLQNKLIYLVFGLNILMFGLTLLNQFALVSVISMIFCSVNFPTNSKFVRDYQEPEFNDENYNPDFDKSLENELKENFSSEPKNEKKSNKEED